MLIHLISNVWIPKRQSPQMRKIAVLEGARKVASWKESVRIELARQRLRRLSQNDLHPLEQAVVGPVQRASSIRIGTSHLASHCKKPTLQGSSINASFFLDPRSAYGKRAGSPEIDRIHLPQIHQIAHFGDGQANCIFWPLLYLSAGPRGLASKCGIRQPSKYTSSSYCL